MSLLSIDRIIKIKDILEQLDESTVNFSIISTQDLSEQYCFEGRFIYTPFQYVFIKTHSLPDKCLWYTSCFFDYFRQPNGPFQSNPQSTKETNLAEMLFKGQIYGEEYIKGYNDDLKETQFIKQNYYLKARKFYFNEWTQRFTDNINELRPQIDFKVRSMRQCRQQIKQRLQAEKIQGQTCYYIPQYNYSAEYINKADYERKLSFNYQLPERTNNQTPKKKEFYYDAPQVLSRQVYNQSPQTFYSSRTQTPEQVYEKQVENDEFYNYQ